MTPKELLSIEAANPCPFGLVCVSDEEVAVAAEALRKNSNFLISENAARNLAYSMLIALRSKHFEWWREHEGEQK